MEELWSPGLETWFPEKLEDPELALLWVSVTQAEYWEGPSGGLVYLAGVKAMAAGVTFGEVENEKLDLKDLE
jgi:hypothetical protein